MEVIFIICVTGLFGFILFNIINNKRFSAISTLLLVLLVLYYAIKKFDPEYYQNMVKGINNIRLYETITAGTSLIISVIAYIHGCYKHKKKIDSKKRVETIEIESKIDDKENLRDINKVINEDNKSYEEILVYLELMDEEVACFTGGYYLLNNKMRNLLGLVQNKVDKATFINFINKEDRKAMDENKKINNFRLTINDEKWYEEVKASLKGTIYKLIRECKNVKTNKLVIKTFKELTNTLKEYVKANKNYYLVFFDLMNTSDISGFYGQEFTNMIINKYLKKLSNSAYINETKIYYISKTEYVILLDDKTEYNILISELESGEGDILRQEIEMNDNKVIIKSKVGAISSKDVVDNSVSSVINKGFDTLKLASSINYKGDYAIYSRVDDEIDYSAKDLNIDLDIDLDEYKKRLK